MAGRAGHRPHAGGDCAAAQSVYIPTPVNLLLDEMAAFPAGWPTWGCLTRWRRCAGCKRPAIRGGARWITY